MGQALWWAIPTVTTVGFGDVVPRTTARRSFALVPMIAGVTLGRLIKVQPWMQSGSGMQ